MSDSMYLRRVSDKTPGKYVIASTYFSRALVDHGRAVPGMRWDPAERGWVGYADAVMATAARLRTAGINVMIEDQIDPESWRTARTPFLFSTKGLREYQIDGVRFLIMRSGEGALLADGMRLGKSCQSLIAARAFKQKTLVLCPPHLVGVWGRPADAPEGPGEIAKWWPAVDVQVLETIKPYAASQVVRRGVTLDATKDAKRKLEAAHAELRMRADAIQGAAVIVCHYDIVYAWVDVLRLWNPATLIIDEGHNLAGWQSRRAEAIKELRKIVSRCMVLTGTPVTNTPSKTHNLLDILAPGRFGHFVGGTGPGQTLNGYASVYCDPRQETFGRGIDQKTVWNFNGRSNLDKPDGETALTKEETLRERLSYVMLRRLKKDVDPQLPSKVRSIIDVAVPARAAIGLTGGMLQGQGDELRAALNLAADGKFGPVVKVVQGHVDEGEKVICACYRRLFAERVADELSAKADQNTLVMHVHGGMPQKERDRRIHAMRKHEGPGVLACTIDTTSTGIDLSFAGVMVVAELVWEPHELAQLEERLYRFGSDAKALIEYIIARGTGDELILKGVIQKLDTFERVVGSTGDGMREDLENKKKADGKTALARLYETLVAMQAAGATPGAKKRTPKKGVNRG